MSVLFLTISVLGLLAAAGTVLARNLVHAALFLVAFFFVVACQFVMLEAEFLAAVQVLVYIGAVAIILMFGIMLTRNVQGDETTTSAPGWTLPAFIGGLGLFLILVFGINNQVGLGPGGRGEYPWNASELRKPITQIQAEKGGEARAAAMNDMGKETGRQLMTRYAVPFEVAGLLLTAALVGAVALAYREGDDAESPRRGVKPTRVHGSTVATQNGSAPEPAEPVTSTTS